MIRIITDTTFGYWTPKGVEPKTKNSDPFEVSPEREAELVALGVAEYVTGEIDADGNFVADGEIIGHTEGDFVTITDQDVIDETLKDDDDQTAVKSVDGIDVTVESLEAMKLEQLKEFAEPLGVEYKVGTKKSEFAKMVFDAIVFDGSDCGDADDAEDPLQFDAATSVV